MKIQQVSTNDTKLLSSQLQPLAGLNPNLVLVFATPEFFAAGGEDQLFRQCFPNAELLGCSTAGEVVVSGVQEKSIVVTAISFETTQVISASTELENMADSFSAGRQLAELLAVPDLRAVLVLGQGVSINGSALVEGMTEVLGTAIPITGGLAGDNGAFVKTYTLGSCGVSSRNIVAIGLAGQKLHVGHGSYGGWEPFGPVRKVTRCNGNVLYELDGERALDIYKRYLGEYANDLPASGLLFPFAMLDQDLATIGLIRTILGMDEQQGSLTLAGEIQQGGYLKLMHASTDTLVDGAEAAARAVTEMSSLPSPALAILVSCVGRKLVMGERIDEEIEVVADVLGKTTTLTGFYSYGEISPFSPAGSCKLHNQTMTITTFAEG
jgi:hypothetical protein